jgi:hypothetical protein
VKRDAAEDTEPHGKDALSSRCNEKRATAVARTAAAGSKPEE